MDMSKHFLFLILVFLSNMTFSQTDQVVFPGNVKSLKKVDHGVLVKTDHAYMMIQAYQDQVIRVRLSKTPFTVDFSYAVIQKPEGNFKEIREFPGEWELTTGSLKIILTKKPVSLKVYNHDNQVLCGLPEVFLHLAGDGSDHL